MSEKKSKRWFLPTNTENLEIFFSKGLVTCAAGLDSSYINDAMAGYPSGYIPFFSIENLNEGILKSREDDENLICCIIELDLSEILDMRVYVGVDRTLDASEAINDCYFELIGIHDLEVSQHEMFIALSPLPIQCIKNVIFESKNIKNENFKSFKRKLSYIPDKIFAEDAKLFKAEKEKDLYSGNSEEICIDLPERDFNYNKTSSFGGMLALMFYQSKNGNDSVRCFEEVCSLERISNYPCKEFQLLNNYFYDHLNEADEYGLLYFNLLDLLSEDKGSVSEIKYCILSYLDKAEGLKDLKEFVLKMAERLRAIEDRTIDSTPEEVFTRLMESYAEKNNKEHKKILMILVMYFYRDNVETMLKFYHKEFQYIDYMLFSMFFGIGCQYVGLPSSIKNIEGLNLYISNRMAEFHHKSSDTRKLFKNVSKPKYIFNDLIKEKSNGARDKFIEWLSDYLKLDADKYESWELRHKGFFCDTKSLLAFTNKPSLSTIINIKEMEQQILAATISNDTDLFDYNEVYNQYKKLSK